MNQTMFCASCGAEMPKAARACPSCGARVKKGSSAAIWIAVAAVVVLFVGIGVVGILAAIAIPAYQDYTVRAQTAGAYATASAASVAVGLYYAEHKEIPLNLETAGFNTPMPQNVQAIDIDQQTATLSVQFTSGVLSGKTLLLTPTLNDQGNLDWVCTSDSIPTKLLPAPCR